MYSAQPFPNPADDHVGFYVILVMATIFVCAAFYVSQRKDDRIYVSALVGFFVMVAAVVSWWPPETVPRNIKVSATLVDVYSKSESSGKYSVSDYAYVVYQVPEGTVVFRRMHGVAYPNYAILYKY